MQTLSRIYYLVYLFSILYSVGNAAVTTNSVDLASTAQAHFDDTEYDAAITTAKQVLTEPNMPKSTRDQALNVLAWSYFQKKDYQQALTEFENITVNYPDSRYYGSSMMMVAQCYQTTGNILSAIQTYAKVLYLYPNPNEYRTIVAKNELASLYLSLKTTNIAAINALHKDTSFIAILPECLFTAGQTQIDKRQDYAAAARYFQEIADNHQQFKQADITMWKLGICLEEQHKYYDAITVYRQVIEKFPASRYRYHAQFGVFYTVNMVGNPEETIEEAKKLLDSPNSEYKKYAAFSIASLYTMDRRYQEAIQVLQAQIEKDPKSSYVDDYQRRIKQISSLASIPYSAPRPVKTFSNASAELDALIASCNNIDEVFMKIEAAELFKTFRNNYRTTDQKILNEALSLLTTYPHWLVRERCASVLMFSTNNPTVAKGMINALNTEKDINVRIDIAKTLGDARVVEAIPGIIKCIQAFSQQTGYYMDCLNVRGSVIQSLGKCGPAATKSLIELSKNDRIWRRYAQDLIVALKNTGDKRMLPVLAEWMHNPNSEIRITAASAAIPLSSSSPDNPDNKELIFNTLVELTNDSSSYVRERAARTLGVFGDARAIPHLERLLRDRAEITYKITENDISREERHLPVREAAQQALEKLGYSFKKTN